MKKVVTLLMIAILLMCITSMASADKIVEFHGEYWIEDEDGGLHPYTGRPIAFKRDKINRNFPGNIMHDTTDLCSFYNGTEVNCLGLVCTGGTNLRSRADQSGRQVEVGWGEDGLKLDVQGGSIIGKIHGDETIFVCFSIYGSDNYEYYYVIRSNGEEGFVSAKRVLVFKELHFEW